MSTKSSSRDSTKIEPTPLDVLLEEHPEKATPQVVLRRWFWPKPVEVPTSKPSDPTPPKR